MLAPDRLIYTITASPLGDVEELGSEWRALENLSTRHSFFLSWHWIGSWLKCLPPSVQPRILRVKERERLIGLAVLCEGKTSLLRFLRMQQVALNTTGDRRLDTITMEYNGFLSMDGSQEAVEREALGWLLRGGIPNHSIRLNGVDEALVALASSQAKTHRGQVQVMNTSPCPFVDLAGIRGSGKEYDAFLSRNTRQALKRSLRHYEKLGPFDYHTANTPAEAVELFAALEAAHQFYWRKRGKPGAFANAFFRQFHTTLINSAFTAGHVELARISAGDNSIGYLYNFIWRDIVYAYQSGFIYTDDKTARPGYVSHYLAIQNALNGGKSVYDFMAGEAQHKFSLATGIRKMAWLQLQRRSPLITIDRLVRNLLRILRKQRAHP